MFTADPYFTVGHVSSRSQRSLAKAAYPQLQPLNGGLALLQISADVDHRSSLSGRPCPIKGWRDGVFGSFAFG
jgi:hypothetical protein